MDGSDHSRGPGACGAGLPSPPTLRQRRSRSPLLGSRDCACPARAGEGGAALRGLVVNLPRILRAAATGLRAMADELTPEPAPLDRYGEILQCPECSGALPPGAPAVRNQFGVWCHETCPAPAVEAQEPRRRAGLRIEDASPDDPASKPYASPGSELERANQTIAAIYLSRALRRFSPNQKGNA